MESRPGSNGNGLIRSLGLDRAILPQPKVSRHLAYLRRTALVLTRREGLWNYYRLAPAQSPFHEKLLECLGTCFREVPELAQDSQRLKKSIANWCC
jgi:ArsR family transcriptional regulator, arsenate/arsenite/antimonite-responsive transcriptional repressor